LSRAHIAANHISSVKRYCDKAEIVFDTVDLQFLRESRRAEVENSKKVLEEAGKLKRLEFRLARMSDITFVVSPVEKEIMLTEDPSLRIEVVSTIHQITQPQRSFSERRDIMFVGGFAHQPNIDAVEWFVREIFPLIKEKIPAIKFYVVGSEPPREITRLNSNDIIITGYVKDLAPYFENCKLSVSPLRYGAGVKGKINHSMSYGLPVVTTSIGAEGIELIDGENALIANDPEEFARKVILLYKDEEMWHKLSTNSLENVRNNYLYDVIKNKLKSVLDNFNSPK
jgi:glycosyltransferase involved in cell wall biosynthesis